ncbi:hypothetical protein P4B35_02415 [Pontiellaceae bacterium B12227]|nr:hypothetical protein [Pontiellaceae bacterium B12227]
MKRKIAIWSIGTFAFALLGIFVLGLIWSIFPMVGNTLPHHLAARTGVSFGWSALLISSLLGLSLVGSIVLFAFIQTLERDGQLDW